MMAKLQTSRLAARNTAFTLIEMLIYMGLLVVILGFAYAAMYRSMDSSVALRHNLSDISRAMEAGELWRSDVRHATRFVRLQNTTNAEQILDLPQPRGEIAYRFTSNSVSRRVGRRAWTVVLRNVKNSQMIADRRDDVTAWRWELELQPSRKKLSRMRPLFTFIAVPATASSR